MRDVRTQRVAGTILIGTILLAACHSVRPAPATSRFITAEKPSRVWITNHDSSVVVVDWPTMEGDTINGSVNGQYTDHVAQLSKIAHMQARTPSPAKTMGVVTLVLGAMVGTLYLLKELAESIDQTTP